MNLRYKICPQMEVYDRMGVNWQPYVMFGSTPDFRSHVVNTDRFGLRHTIFDKKVLTTECVKTYANCSIIIGGSTVFGVGSSSDRFTVASILSDLANVPCVNLGGRAYNSTQELILFTRLATYFPKIDNVLIFSGLNNLYLSMFAEEVFAPFFFSRFFNESLRRENPTGKRKILKYVLDPIYGSTIDYSKVTASELLSALFKFQPRNTPTGEAAKKVDISRALKVNQQDLSIWKLLSESMHFNLHYIMQPVPSWTQKKISKEEAQLFEFLDLQKNAFGDQKALSDFRTYAEYRASLECICKDLKINFSDANPMIGCTNDWLFVDRAHLNDGGNLLIAKNFVNLLS